ncbi:MAG: hypothetical protein IJ666_04310 [Ruminococcus sp.]|nr:hypothetical protein [Ruminococcus sp.]
MNFTDIYLLAQSEVEQPGLFPFPFGLHVAFSVFAVIFLVYRFVKEKYPYQLIMAAAIPISLIIWVSDNKTLFYAIGIIELVLMLIAMLTSMFIKKPEKKPAEETADDGGGQGEEE